jgi:rRNA-processing protein FCF1
LTSTQSKLGHVITRVLPDANVLFSRTQRDWLFLLRHETGANMFTIGTTVDIVAETVARLRDAYPDAQGQTTARIHDQILSAADERFDDFVIEGNWQGADQGDAHVDAAARSGDVDIILTCDKGWSRLLPEQLDALPYEVMHPDHFFCLVAESHPQCLQRVVLTQTRYWLQRSDDVNLSQRLRRAGCPEFADKVRAHSRRIDVSALIDSP